ncbi:MAG: Nif11-like leader peptide family RiPP precursor [Acidobacteria bacterium]|nr:Nif11-like leader peptide family RiPP precursor [Acidobacteriota bacterium]
MSVQKAKDFLVHIATDEAASAKARQAHEAALLEVASELGFSFSAEDLQAAMDDMGSLDELSAAELQGLAGGRARRFYDS